jgi:hypothetical protein
MYAPWANDRKGIICTVDPSAQWGNDKKAGQANWIIAMESAHRPQHPRRPQQQAGAAARGAAQADEVRWSTAFPA